MTSLANLPAETALGQRLSAILAPRPPLSLLDWARQHLYLTRGPAVLSSGAAVHWDPSFDPLSVTMMEALTNPKWSRIVEMGSPQASGKTLRAIALMLWMIDQRGSDVLYFSASASLAHDQWKKKIGPAMEAAPRLRALRPELRDLAGVTERRDFSNGASLYLRGAESRGAISGVSVALTIGDDVQAMQTFPEGDHPCDVARERADALPGRRQRHVILGQPGTTLDYLSRELFGSTFYVPLIPCPTCGTYQMLDWSRMEHPDDPGLALFETRLRCANGQCQARIASGDLRWMLARHVWVSVPPGENWLTDPPAGGVALPAETIELARRAADAGDSDAAAKLPYAVYPETQRPTRVCGFWRSALYWLWVSWGEQAVKFLDARGSPEKLLNFQRRIDGRPFQPPEDQAGMEPAEVAAHMHKGHEWQTVPEWADVLTVTVDAQGGYVYYLTRAWRRADGASALVEVGSTKEQHERPGLPGGLEVIAAKVAAGWRRAGAADDVPKVAPLLVLVDGRYQPDLVFRHCVRYGTRRWRPIQGQHRPGLMLPIWSGKPATVQGRWYWAVGVNEAKTLLWKLLQIPPGQPAYWSMPEDVPPKTLTAYTRHMTSEVWDDEKRRWVPRKQRKLPGQPAERAGRNDWWDCETYQIAAALACGVKLPSLTLPPPPPRDETVRPVPRPGPAPQPLGRPRRWRSPGIRRVY